MKRLTCSLAFVSLLSGSALAADPEGGVSLLDQIRGHSPASITGNPAAVDAMPGTGLAGQLLHIPEWTGLRIGGVWLADTNGLISGGAQPGKWSWNSALIVGANLDAETLIGWKGASFGIQFLQFDGQNTNGQAGSVQGYNSLPGPNPLHRSELYQLWYRQSLFDDRITVRIGKQVPTYDFNNVARPVSTQDEGLEIPSVTGLLFTPVFVQPTLLGAIGGYYNSVSGIALTVAPTKNTYFKYGVYDGNVARGVQTGMEGPSFNGYYFHIWEAGMDWIVADKYPGTLGAGLWYQTGVLHGGVSKSITEDGIGGFYMFGSQRIWSNHGPTQPADGGKVSDGGKVRDGKSVVGKNKLVISPDPIQKSSISAFFQFGVNNSETLPMNQSFGLGLTGFGLVPHRPKDSIGAGMSWAWLNPNIFDRSSELMFQTYYQAHLFGGTFFQPAVSYIPTPGGSPGQGDLGGAWALTFRLTTLF
jgi:porin